MSNDLRAQVWLARLDPESITWRVHSHAGCWYHEDDLLTEARLAAALARACDADGFGFTDTGYGEPSIGVALERGWWCNVLGLSRSRFAAAVAADLVPGGDLPGWRFPDRSVDERVAVTERDGFVLIERAQENFIEHEARELTFPRWRG